jgi:predicted unusual protein kinase regulating ubiquinone biosynthesis (AarF/ABC1/UbiB family)
VFRTLRPAALGARVATRWAGTYLGRPGSRKARQERVMLRTADDVTRTLGEMKGAAMKVGQVLSLMTGVVPPEMAEGLASLHANAPPMAYSLMEGVFREEYGKRPDELFRRFEREPFAAASIGQVHRAELRGGGTVAVKVQYPGVREAIDADLANIGVFLGMAGVFAKGLDAGPISNDLKEGIRAELDYRREAAWQAHFGELFAGHSFVRVPRVYGELSTGRVLVQEYLRGRPFSTARGLGQAERDRIAEILFRFAFGNFYRHRLFNGDPHPGNYLLLDDGRIGFVDYGCVAEFPPEAVTHFEVLLRALFAGDLPGWRAATEEIGILRRDAPYSTEALYEHMHWFWKPVLAERVTFTPELAAEMVRRNTQATGDGGAVNRHLNIPPGMVFLSRINLGLAGLLGSLHANGPWQGIIREYIDGEPPQTWLGQESARTSIGPSI